MPPAGRVKNRGLCTSVCGNPGGPPEHSKDPRKGRGPENRLGGRNKRDVEGNGRPRSATAAPEPGRPDDNERLHQLKFPFPRRSEDTPSRRLPGWLQNCPLLRGRRDWMTAGDLLVLRAREPVGQQNHLSFPRRSLQFFSQVTMGETGPPPESSRSHLGGAAPSTPEASRSASGRPPGTSSTVLGPGPLSTADP